MMLDQILDILKTNHVANLAATYCLIIGWIFGFASACLVHQINKNAKELKRLKDLQGILK